MQPILIFKDENAIDTAQSQLYEAKEFYQNIVDQFNSLELGTDKKLSGNDLLLLIQNSKAFIVDKVTQGEKLTIGSMPISKEKAFEVLELPAKLYQIIALVEKVKKGDHQSGFAIRNYTTSFIIINGNVEFTDKCLQEIEKANSVYATTNDQLKSWELMQEIATKLNQLRAITSKSGYTLNTEDMDLFFGINEYKDASLMNKANPAVIKRLN